MPDLTPDVTTTPNFDPGRVAIASGWLVDDVGYHACGGYGPESGYAHEPGCGAEPMCEVTDIPDILAAAAERDALAESVRAYGRTIDRWGLLIIAATHSEDITTPDGDGDWEVIESRGGPAGSRRTEQQGRPMTARTGADTPLIERRPRCPKWGRR